jgi:hypothetical protein
MLRAFAFLILMGATNTSAHPNAIEIALQQQTERPVKGESNSTYQQRQSANELAAAQITKSEQNHNYTSQADQGAGDKSAESSEYWWSFGHHVKITDSLLATFTALLTIFTGFLVWIGWMQNIGICRVRALIRSSIVKSFRTSCRASRSAMYIWPRLAVYALAD